MNDDYVRLHSERCKCPDCVGPARFPSTPDIPSQTLLIPRDAWDAAGRPSTMEEFARKRMASVPLPPVAPVPGSMESVIPALRIGLGIRRRCWSEALVIYQNSEINLTTDDLLAMDWESTP